MKKVVLVFLAMALATAAWGFPTLDEVTAGYGKSRDWVTVERVGLRSNFGDSWIYNCLTGFWELSGNYWSKDGDKIYGGALSPVFVLQTPHPLGNWQPYIDGGIGAACISRTMIGDRDMSSLFQFEDRVGVGVKWRSLDFHVGYMHYSNADIVPPNQGIDIFIATVGCCF